MPGAAASDTLIRPYTAPDRAAVRDVCYRTGYMGEPIDWQWRDEESFADLFTSYYTDAEPESALVVEQAGRVTGYLLGCVDSTRVWTPQSIVARHLVRRGVALRPGTAGVIWRTVGDAALDLASRRLALRDLEFSDPRWPAHLHIDLLPAARGRGVGRQLVRRWLTALDERGGVGCHLQTMAENTAALAFFETVGFERRGGPVLTPGLRTRAGERMHVQVMVHAPAG